MEEKFKGAEKKGAENNSAENKFTDKQVREKAVNLGVESLDDAQLLSILFREGDAQRSALQMAQALVDGVGGKLSNLSNTELRKLRSMGGIGLSKAMYIKAAIELGRRCSESSGSEIETIGSSREVVEIFRPLIGSLPHEELWALYLNNAGRVLDKIRISQGGIAQTVVDHRIIVKRAVENLATTIILIHNHPSGDSTPSAEDKEITQKIVQAAELFEIKIADHIIVTSSSSHSMRAEGLL